MQVRTNSAQTLMGKLRNMAGVGVLPALNPCRYSPVRIP